MVHIFRAASEMGLPCWLLAGCMWSGAVAPLCTKARIRAGAEAYHEPLLCLDWKGNSSFSLGLFTEASLPQFVGIVPVRTTETKSSHGGACFCQPGIDPVMMASNERRNTLGNDISVVFVCAHNERYLVLTGFGFHYSPMEAENLNVLRMLWSRRCWAKCWTQDDTKTSGLMCFFVFSCKCHVCLEVVVSSDQAAALALACTSNILTPKSTQNTKSEFTVHWLKERPKMKNNNRGSKFKIAAAKIDGREILSWRRSNM